MHVAGGIYRERCKVPAWDFFFGSGGRSAVALRNMSPGISLHAFCGTKDKDDISLAFGALNISTFLHDVDSTVEFEYFHPMSSPDIHPKTGFYPPSRRQIDVSGEVVLRFGFVEGSAVVYARTAVYDPQSGEFPQWFTDNGSKADRLSYVLNDTELFKLTGISDIDRAAQRVFDREGAEVVVVKSSTRGGTVYVSKQTAVRFPAFRSGGVFKIGSGDVFTAVFAHLWGELDVDPHRAAVEASRRVAYYAATRNLPLPATIPHYPEAPPIHHYGKIYLAGPFFSIGQRWVIEELRQCLEKLGVPVFSPLHEVGWAHDDSVAKADLEGLEKCDGVLAVLDGGDPGSLFEVGYARAMKMPVVILAESVPERDQTMISGSGCTVTHDISTAVYEAAWKVAR